MKIISKYKDYYDWCVSIYGIDDNIIYDRRFKQINTDTLHTDYSGVSKYVFHIAGYIYTVYKYDGDFYHTADEIQQLDSILSPKYKIFYTKKYWGWPSTKEHYQSVFDERNGIKTQYNELLRVPVLLETNKFFAEWTVGDKGFASVILSDFGFAKWYDASDMFRKIYDFLSYLKDRPEIPNKQTDKEKVLSHGFDLKKSFRHRK